MRLPRRAAARRRLCAGPKLVAVATTAPPCRVFNRTRTFNTTRRKFQVPQSHGRMCGRYRLLYTDRIGRRWGVAINREYRSGRSSQCQQQRFNPRLVRHPGARTCGRRLAAAATPATFSLLLCVHAGSPWPSLIFIRRHAASEVAFPKAQPLRAHLDPTTIGMPLQAHLEPPDRRIVGVHVADLAVVFGLRNPLTRTRQPTSQ